MELGHYSDTPSKPNVPWDVVQLLLLPEPGENGKESNEIAGVIWLARTWVDVISTPDVDRTYVRSQLLEASETHPLVGTLTGSITRDSDIKNLTEDEQAHWLCEEINALAHAVEANPEKAYVATRRIGASTSWRKALS